MLSQKERDFQPCVVSLEALVPEDNFYRQVEAKLDLTFVRNLVQHLYKPFGRPSIDPIVFFKLHLIMFFEDIRSERQLMKTVAMRLDHRWYIGYDLDEPVPNHSSLSKIRDRYGLKVFQRFFEQIVQMCIDADLVWGRELHFDGTMVRANAAYDQQVPRFYHQAQQHLHELFEVPDQDARGLVSKYDGKRNVVRRNSYRKQSDNWVSPIDSAATSLGQSRLGYHLHYAVDGGRSRIILNCLVTPASVQDNMPMLDMAWQTQFRWHLPLKQIVGDRRFGTIDNVVAVELNAIRAFLPLHTEVARSRQQKMLFPSNQFQFDAERNLYICPQGQELTHFKIDHQEQRLVYKAPDHVCAACPLRSQCTRGKLGRTVSHSTHKAILDRVQAYQQTEAYKKAMRKRQVWVEPKFAEVKEWHHGTKFRLRGLFKVNIEALLKAAGQNIKQLLKVKAGQNRPKSPAHSMASWPFSTIYSAGSCYGLLPDSFRRQIYKTP